MLKTDEVNKVEFKKEDDEEVLEMAKGKRRKKEEKGGEGMARGKGNWIAGARVDLGVNF